MANDRKRGLSPVEPENPWFKKVKPGKEKVEYYECEVTGCTANHPALMKEPSSGDYCQRCLRHRILQDVKSAWGVWAKADPGTRISAIKQRHTVNCAAIRDLEMWKQTYQPEAGKKALTEEREAQIVRKINAYIHRDAEEAARQDEATMWTYPDLIPEADLIFRQLGHDESNICSQCREKCANYHFYDVDDPESSTHVECVNCRLDDQLDEAARNGEFVAGHKFDIVEYWDNVQLGQPPNDSLRAPLRRFVAVFLEEWTLGMEGAGFKVPDDVQAEFSAWSVRFVDSFFAPDENAGSGRGIFDRLPDSEYNEDGDLLTVTDETSSRLATGGKDVTMAEAGPVNERRSSTDTGFLTDGAEALRRAYKQAESASKVVRNRDRMLEALTKLRDECSPAEAQAVFDGIPEHVRMTLLSPQATGRSE